MNPKTRWIVGALAVVALSVGIVRVVRRGDAAPASTGTPPAPPPDSRSLRVSPTEVDFGEVPLGQQRERAVRLTNTGKRPVTIYRIDVTCGCLSAELKKNTIEPGETGELRLTFKGVPGKRTNVSTIGLITDESGPSRYDVAVQGKVEQDLVLEPETLQLGHIVRGGWAFGESVLRHKGGKPFVLQAIKSGRTEFEFSWQPADGAKSSEYKILVKARGLRTGVATDAASIMTDFTPLPMIPLTVALEVDGDFTVKPISAVIRPEVNSKDSTCEVRIRSTKSKPVVIEAVEEGRGLRTEFKTSPDPEGGVLLQLRLSTIDLSSTVFGEFVIRVRDDEDPIHMAYRFDSVLKAAGSP